MPAESSVEIAPTPARSGSRMYVGAVIAVALAAGLVAWVLLRDTGNPPARPAVASDVFAITAQDLGRLAVSIRQPIFWLGRRPGDTYELTRGQGGKIYLRYLPAGVEVGSAKPYLTVATYPFAGAYSALEKQAAVKGAVTSELAAGGIAVLDSGYPESVHIAYRNVPFQVEVFDPTPAKAMQLVAAGKLASLGGVSSSVAIPAQSGSAPVAVSEAMLKALTVRLGHPIYWAGPKPGYTYELTQTRSGNVYVRYLPAGTKVGDPRASFLTVGTYPFAGAYDAVAKTATDATRVGLPHGGVAVVDSTYPKSIHLAFPGVNYQVEVFDQSPSAARRLAASGAITPVP